MYRLITRIRMFITRILFTSDDATWTNNSNDCPYNEPLHDHHDGCPACDMVDYAEDIDQQAFAQGRESSYS